MRVTDAMFVEAELFAAERLGALNEIERRVELVRAIEAYANRKWDDARLFMSARDDAPPPGLENVDARAQLYLSAMLAVVFPRLAREDTVRLGWFRVMTGNTRVERFFAKVDAIEQSEGSRDG